MVATAPTPSVLLREAGAAGPPARVSQSGLTGRVSRSACHWIGAVGMLVIVAITRRP